MGTDGLRVLKKVYDFKGRMFVIYGIRDEMMPIHFAEDLLTARYKNSWRVDKNNVPVFATVNGTHGQVMFFDERKAKERYTKFLDALTENKASGRSGISSKSGIS